MHIPGVGGLSVATLDTALYCTVGCTDILHTALYCTVICVGTLDTVLYFTVGCLWVHLILHCTVLRAVCGYT